MRKLLDRIREEKIGVLVVVSFVFLCLLPLVLWVWVASFFPRNNRQASEGRITTAGFIRRRDETGSEG